jgi:hypothetical protein
LVIGIVLVAGGAIGYVNLAARADHLQAALTTELQGGQSELEAGKASLSLANSKHDASLIADAVAHFVAAKARFLSASRVADNSRFLSTLEQVPFGGGMVRSRHTAVDRLADMGAALSDAGQDISDLDAQLIKPSAPGQPARTVLNLLDQTKPSLVKVRGDLERAQAAVKRVDVRVLPANQQPAFVKAREMIASALASVDEFERLEPVLREVLGGNGARTYLVEQVNPIELRAGGGFLGTFSLVRADQGTLKLIRSGDSYELADPRPKPGQPDFIPLPGPYREVIPHISWSFVDSNLFPDFPSNAKAALDFVEPRLKTSIDGVISIDYYIVAKVLELTGPLAVPGHNLTVDAASFISLAIQLDLQGSPVHKTIFSALAGPLMEHMASLPADRWPDLISALNDLAGDRHLQAYFKNAAVQSEINRIGWSGRLNLSDGREYMFAVENNFGSKANYYLSRSYVVELTTEGTVLHHKVTINYVNRSPFGTASGRNYHADVRLFVSDTISSGSTNLTPVVIANPPPPPGVRVIEGWLLVECCGSVGQAVFQYDTPWPPAGKDPYRIYWQKQPGTLSDPVNVIWADGHGHTLTTRGDLGQDRLITLTPTGVTMTRGQSSQVNLPRLNLG